MANGIQAAISRCEDPLEKNNMLVEYLVQLEQTVSDQKDKISQLESLLRSGPSSGPVQEQTDGEVPPNTQMLAWTSSFKDSSPGEGIIDFEVVLIPFTSTFRHLWTSKHRHNVRTGPERLWTSIQPERASRSFQVLGITFNKPKITWLDPLIPTEKSDIDTLVKYGLIQRVRVDRNDDDVQQEGGLIRAFLEAFGESLEQVTNVLPPSSLEDKVNRSYGSMEEEPPALPIWASYLRSSIMPLRTTILNDQVLEYLPLTKMYPHIKWDLSFFDNPPMFQEVVDPKTEAPVRRVFFTTVEGYVGFTDNEFGLDPWGMTLEDYED